MSNKDFKVKNGIQPTVYHEAVGTVVSGSEEYYLSGASYSSKSFSVSSQEAIPRGIMFNSSGSKMYVVGENSGSIHQYSLSTAYDVSTASYDSVSLSVSSQDARPEELSFNTDGTKLFLLGDTNDSVYQYSLSTGFDLSTASYDSVSFSVSSQDSAPRGLAFSGDGTKMFIAGDNSDTVYQYGLSTAFDLSTASYSSVSFSVSSQDDIPMDVAFNNDGTKMYTVDTRNYTVYQYSLSTGFDLSTASYDSVSFSVASQDTSPVSVSFSSDGSSMFVLGGGTDTVYQYSTVLNTAQLDLSTGSVFDYTPTSDVQVTLTNPATSGTSSGATLLLGSEDAAGVSSTFSTTLYDGTGTSPNKITNNIDLAGDGGLVWIKTRGTTADHCLGDTEQGAGYYLQSNNTEGYGSQDFGNIVSFNSDGFTVGNYTRVNVVGPLVSWTFKKQAKFFDIVTYTGNGSSNRQISHNLGDEVGMLVVKRTDGANPWAVYHRGADATAPEDKELQLNAIDAAVNGYTTWARTAPTTTNFTVGSEGKVNENGWSYVAYLFAHDTDASSLIKCGSYTGNGSTNGPTVNLGWEPQWLMTKNITATSNWMIIDKERGFVSGGNDATLAADSTAAENGVIGSVSAANPLSTGFKLTASVTAANAPGATHIYMAIRNPFIPTITYDPDLQWSGGTAPTAPATGETDVITFNTTDGGTTYRSALAIDGAK